MQTTWIVAADASRARIFEMEGDSDKLREIEDMINPQDRQQSAQQHDVAQFSREVSRFIDKACGEQRFDALCVIAPPRFIGLMRENLCEQARQAVTEEIPKDIAWFEGRDIEKYVREHLH